MTIDEIRKVMEQGKANVASREKIARELWDTAVMDRIIAQAEMGKAKLGFKEAPVPVLQALIPIALEWGCVRAAVVNDRFGPGKILMLDWNDLPAEGEQ